MFSFFPQQKKGFALLEAAIGIGLFLLFAVGIYSGIHSVFRSVFFSRIRIIETAILNEQVEIIRNLPFSDVGIVQGSPAGVLSRTVSVQRNGIDFTITRTIRNIDDPFDGLIGGGSTAECSGNLVPVCHNDATLCVNPNAVSGHTGHGDAPHACDDTPNDTAPADYKLIDIEVICDSCGQQHPAKMSTLLAPKFLEGDPTHGALKITVYENDYQSVVQGAEVTIVATSTDPTYNFTDTTNNDGELLIVDLAEGVQAYHITVTKDGYTTDFTTTTGANPVRPPASVIAQDIQTISFEINPISTIELTTTDAACVPVGLVSTNIVGERLISTEPDEHEVDETRSTNASGLYTFTNLPPDEYNLNTNAYDVLGSIPMLPLIATAGSYTPLQLLVGPNTNHSLLIHARDESNLEAISYAAVQLTDAGSYDETLVTGLGHSAQTDWSGGAGQAQSVYKDQYFSDDGNIDALSTAGSIRLSQSGGFYQSSGTLESSTFDLGTSVNFVNLGWMPYAQPGETGDDPVRFQIATDSTSTPESWNFLGPDGTGGSYYKPGAVSISDIHDGDQFFRYKVYLSTASSSYTPSLSEITFGYTTSCTPPGQAYFGDLSNQVYTVSITADGYAPFSGDITAEGNTFFIADMIPE